MARWSTLTLPLVCLASLLILTGCLSTPFGGPSEQERPVELILNNSANETQTFEVWVVEAGATVETHRTDGLSGNYTVGQGVASHSSGPHAWKTVEPPDSARLHGRFTGDPGEEKQSSIKNFSRNSAVVVVLYQDNQSGWWVSANCDEQALVGLEVHIRPSQYGDAWAGYGCQ